MKLIDAHVHILPKARLRGGMKWIKQLSPSLPIKDDITEEDILQELKGMGTDYFINYVFPLKPGTSRELNRWNFELINRIDNAYGFASLHPEDEDKVDILNEAILEFGLMGLKFHPPVQGFLPTDRRFYAVYERMVELGKPVIFHSGFQLHEVKVNSKEIKKLLKDFPNLTIGLAHMLHPELDELFQLIEKYENIYVDTSLVFSDFKICLPGGVSTYVSYNSNSENLERFCHRIMYGTDYPFPLVAPEKTYENILKLKLKDGALEAIFFHTAFQFIQKYSRKKISQ